ncbi:zinc finger CCCH domain-containing protein 24 [Iris pallida]|uniref:Zinc finger CCCH domain-containing protein 24 n=1 Tax=Iris pallida TaxID=29817 RepID=A0AAX6FSH3_IRIPA|nr:zinc finger CCCH domain-containing protein 24 [Iris pallida]
MEVAEEIQPSTPQPTDEAISATDSKPTEKRKREEEDGEASPPPAGGARADPVRNPLWKTSLCSFFRRSAVGHCSHGDACRYAHGEAELRQRPDKSWDPTSERAKKMRMADGPEDPSEEDEAVDVNSLDKCVTGLSNKWISDDLKRFLDGQGILYKSAKKKKGMSVGFVLFEDAEQVKNAIEVLNETSANGRQIKVADANRRSHEKKHTTVVTESHQHNEDNSMEDVEAIGNGNCVGLGPKTRHVCDVVTPLAHMSYSDQLEYKKNSLSQMLKRLTKNTRKACPDAVPLPDWISKSREIGGLPCKLEGILESPLIDGYRNKCEFSVGQSVEGKRTVGFMLGNFREGVTAVEEPVNCPNVSRISCKYALIFQDFLQSSEFPVWNRVDNTGFWRQFTVREGRNPGQTAIAQNADAAIAEVMLIVQVCSVNIDEELMKNEFNRMAQALAEGAASSSPPLPLTKLVVQDHKGMSNAAPADCPLLPLPIPNIGDPTLGVSITTEARIHDYISNLRFSISPTAFFQVNTLAAERLYSLAGDWAELSSDTLLFDVCCGTGTIGLTLAHRVGMVIGIEMNVSAVSDANRNAEINGIKNCKFVCGKAEDVMGSLLKEYLGIPQEHKEASEDTETNSTASTSSEEILLCEGSRNMGVPEQKLEGETPNNSLAIESLNHKTSECSNQKTDGTHVPIGSLRKCSTECNETNQDNEEGKDARQDNSKCINLNEHNTEGENRGKGNCISEDKNAKDAASVHQFKNVVAIVDPPRVGLHPTVIKVLRTHPRIRRLVYISCNPESLVANAIELCTPTSETSEKGQGNRGWRRMSNAGLARQRAKNMPNSEPFRPVRAMAVDLFPHTPHCEMVMLLER